MKFYDLILHELEYMFDAVDPIKAMHLLPVTVRAVCRTLVQSI